MQTIRMWFTDRSTADELALKLKHLVMPGDLVSDEARRLFKPYAIFERRLLITVGDRHICNFTEVIRLGLDNADRTEIYMGNKQWALLGWALPSLHQKQRK